MTVSAAPQSLRAGSDLAGVLRGLGAAALWRELRAPPLLVLVAGMAVYAAVLTRLALVKHHTFNSAIYDLGIFDQVIWNSANGRPFAISIFAQHSLGNYLGEHTSPILLLFVPLYWLYDGAETLLVTQTLYIAAAALPIYLLGRLWLGSAWSGTALALSYLLQTHVTLINLFDFHPDTLQLLFVPLLFYGFHAGRLRLTLVVAAASLAVKEDAGLFVAAFGLYAALHSGRRRLGLALILAGALWFALSIYVVIPALRTEPYVFLERFEEHGGTPVEIALKLLGDPAATAALILTPQKLEYVVTLLRGLGFTPLLGAPVLVATAPQLFGNLVSNSAAQWHLSYQYTCIVVATFAVAAVRGLEWITWATGWLASRAGSSGVRLTRAAPLLLSLLVLTSAVVGYLEGDPIGAKAKEGAFTPRANQAAAMAALALIPPEASVSAQNALGAQLAHRQTLRLFPALTPRRPHPPVDTDFVLVDLADDRWTGHPAAGGTAALALTRLVPLDRYERRFERDGIVLLARLR